MKKLSAPVKKHLQSEINRCTKKLSTLAKLKGNNIPQRIRGIAHQLKYLQEMLSVYLYDTSYKILMRCIWNHDFRLLEAVIKELGGKYPGRKYHGILIAAATMGLDDLVEVLLNKGWELNHAGRGGTVLEAAASRYTDNSKLIKYLVNRGADVNQKGLLRCAVRGEDKNWITLLACGMKPNLEERTNAIKGLIRSYRGPQTLQKMIAKGMLTDIIGSRSTSEADIVGAAIAAGDNNIDMVLEAGFTLNTKDSAGNTALTLAARSERYKWYPDASTRKTNDIIKLIGGGADITMRDSDNKTALDYLDKQAAGIISKYIKLLHDKKEVLIASNDLVGTGIDSEVKLA